MARTTAALVQALLGPNWDGESDVSPYIASAMVLVDRVAACATKKGQPLTGLVSGAQGPDTPNTELELIERWLSCHFYAAMDQIQTGGNAGAASGQFQGQTTMNVKATKYGQGALNIDSSGCLTAITERQVAGGFWAGTQLSCNPPSAGS